MSWETNCPVCNSTDGELDMVRANRSLQYVFRCRLCNKGYWAGLVMGPTEKLRAKYLAFLDEDELSERKVD